MRWEKNPVKSLNKVNVSGHSASTAGVGVVCATGQCSTCGVMNSYAKAPLSPYLSFIPLINEWEFHVSIQIELWQQQETV